MLFVLRLLPPAKKTQQRIIVFTMFLNFAITMIATVSYGFRCRPFEAVYENIPNAKCVPTKVITSTMYVNASESFSCHCHLYSAILYLRKPVLACIIDIITALIPQFLL